MAFDDLPPLAQIPGLSSLRPDAGAYTETALARSRAAAVRCPLESLLVETDSPYLAPVPHRGRPNQPAWVAAVGTAIADLRSIPVTEVAAATTANARHLLGVG